MMMTITAQTFLTLLFVSSVFTGLTVEAIKKLVGGYSHSTNVLTAIVAVVMGAIIGIFYCLMSGVLFTVQTIITIIVLIFLSWLGAMVGYDKVVQTIVQIKTK